MCYPVNDRKDIFHDDRARLTFLDVIGEMSDQYHVDIFGYTLMNNHYLCGAPHKKWLGIIALGADTENDFGSSIRNWVPAS